MSPTAATMVAAAGAVATDLTDTRLVIVTGAGASRKLGVATDFPLMGDWAGFLRDELEKAVPGLARAIGLEEGVTGPQFEEIPDYFWSGGRRFNSTRDS